MRGGRSRLPSARRTSGACVRWQGSLHRRTSRRAKRWASRCASAKRRPSVPEPRTVMDTLLVELLTEELPPKALARLGQTFGDTLTKALAQDDFLGPNSASRWFATPRRLAAQVTNVRDVAPDKSVEVAGPSVKVGLDADGRPTPALLGFARKNGVTPEALEQRDTPKGRAFFLRTTTRGSALALSLEAKVAAALRALPIPKIMRWGSGDAEFVRPVHGLVMMHGAR